MKGTFSGGTAASLIATVEAAAREPAIRKTLADPFALTPGFVGAAQPSGNEVVEDIAAGSWVAPFMMGMINTKNGASFEPVAELRLRSGFLFMTG